MVADILLDHYERYLGAWDDGYTFHDETGKVKMQVLTYDRAIPGCRVFLTIGASNLLRVNDLMVEIMAVTDDGWDVIPDILGNAVAYMSECSLVPSPGRRLTGVARSWPDFEAGFGKSALYFPTLFLLANDFQIIDIGHRSDSHPRYAGIVLASFVAAAEVAYLDTHGADTFETLLEARDVDLFHLRRFPVV